MCVAYNIFQHRSQEEIDIPLHVINENSSFANLNGVFSTHYVIVSHETPLIQVGVGASNYSHMLPTS